MREIECIFFSHDIREMYSHSEVSLEVTRLLCSRQITAVLVLCCLMRAVNSDEPGFKPGIIIKEKAQVKCGER